MLKRDLYFAALRDEAHHRKAWVINAFSVTRGVNASVPLRWDIRYNRDNTEVLARQENGEYDWEIIEDVEPYIPVFKAGEKLTVRAGEVPNLDREVETTYGDVMFNWRVLVYAFGPYFPYQVGPISIREIERSIAKQMVDDVEPGQVEDLEKFYVRKYLRYGTAMADLAGFTQLFVPAASAKSLQTHPDAHKRRAELMEENKDRLHDPAVVAGIQNELVDMDRAHIKDDPSEGFFLNSKQFNTARKRQFLIHGPEAGFEEGGSAELVVNSLDEGWDITKMPAMVNSLRAGSYYRGYLTALGGESVKFFLRVFQNTYISEDDCGARIGVVKEVSVKDRDILGMYHFVNGAGGLASVEITEEVLAANNGRKLTIRSPLFCKTAHSDYCAKCMGRQNAEYPLGLGAMAAEIGSTFMSIMMGSAHAKELKTAPLRVDTFLT